MAGKSDQCFTPPHIFETLGLKFDIDVASPPGGVPWVPAKRFYTEADNGLLQPWKGRVWMNPPFSEMTPWVQKFIKHGNGIALLPFAKSKWFHQLWSEQLPIVMLPSNTKFIKNDKPHSIFVQTFLVAAGKTCEQAISKIGVIRNPIT